MVAGGAEAAAAFVDALNDYLAAPFTEPGRATPGRLAAHAEVWDKLARAAAEVDAFNLDRKPFVFSAFSSVAEIARRST